MTEQYKKEGNGVKPEKKPWFIWLSFLSWLILLPWGFFTILFLEKRGIMAWCGFAVRFFLWIMAVIIPAGLLSTAVNLFLPGLAAQIGNIFVLLFLYFAGVYAANKIYLMIK